MFCTLSSLALFISKQRFSFPTHVEIFHLLTLSSNIDTSCFRHRNILHESSLLESQYWLWCCCCCSGVRGSLYRALGLMVAASPCALAVAPLAYATAISACARKGILLKGGEVLDALAVCDTVAFDKTGTLTTGELICKAIEPLRGHGLQEPCCIPSCETEALAVATAMERGAIHPIARAVVDHSQGKQLPAVEIDDFEAIPGEGLMANVSNLEAGDKALHKARLGSLEFITSSCTSSWESLKIKEAASASAYSRKLVRAALSVDRKV
jgi:Cd2+/Zn2+-exporting ATPase